MLIEQRTEVIKNKVLIHYTYIREHWHEWLWLEIGVGEACPRFYLPVYRKEARYGYIAWLTPLAPFVLLFMALGVAFWSFWKDCLWAVEEWRKVERPDEERRRILNDL